jgi:hypothetical protein
MDSKRNVKYLKIILKDVDNGDNQKTHGGQILINAKLKPGKRDKKTELTGRIGGKGPDWATVSLKKKKKKKKKMKKKKNEKKEEEEKNKEEEKEEEKMKKREEEKE